MATAIYALSVEIINKIYRHLDPTSHLNFAIVDKHIFHYSNETLQKHRKFCQYNRKGTSISKALRDVATDHIAAWHLPRIVRGLNHGSKSKKLTNKAGLDALAKIVHATMVANDIPVFGLSGLRNGDFVVLETLIVAFSLGIRTLRSSYFIPGAFKEAEESSDDRSASPDQYDKGEPNDLWYEDDMPQPYIAHGEHNFFTNVVRAFHELEPTPRPPGFGNLRIIIIGKPFAGDFNRALSPTNVAPIFLLPQVKSIYLGGLYEENYVDDPFGVDFTLAQNSSSVEHLFFEYARPETTKEAICAFIESAKSIKSLLFKDCEFNDFDVVITSTEKNSDTHGHRSGDLETILWSQERELDLKGYRCNKFYPEEYLPILSGIRNLTIDIEDVFLTCPSSMQSDNDAEERKSLVEGHDFTEAEINEYFQELMMMCEETEVLVLKTGGWLAESNIPIINNAIVHFIQTATAEAKEEPEEQKCSNCGEVHKWEQESRHHLVLRHIYLDDVLAAAQKPDTWPPEPSTVARSFLDEALSCGKKHGIELHLEFGDTLQFFTQVTNALFDFERTQAPNPGNSALETTAPDLDMV